MTKPRLGVCYYPEHWSQEMWAADAREMVESGLSRVRIGEFAWSRIEPSRGKFDFAWLDEAIEILGRAGLGVIMCTPTATPPKWLFSEMPDMAAVDPDGRKRTFGSRRHYSFSHPGYREESRRITEILAKRFGANPHIVAWQTDNEYGCHDTTVSYCDAARHGFRDWLSQKYQSPDVLNRAWGNVFWSMEYSSFGQVELPILAVTETNPAHRLDFQRYSSQQVVEFNRDQISILRRHAPGLDLVHNFMGRTLDFDHFDVAADLDVASWDSYPIGFLEQFGQDDAWKNWYLRAGDPDFQAFHHDLYRGCGRGRMWVMEQQPGPVNWAPWNPDPHPGMVRLWSHEAIAHGAELVSYFRWRQAPFAQEQLHSGLKRPDDSPDRGLAEAKSVAKDIASLPETEKPPSPVALVFDYTSHWAAGIQRQGADFDSFALVMAFYRALRMLGQSIDIISPDDPFDGYDLVVFPLQIVGSAELADRISSSKAQLLFGPRTFSRTLDHRIPDNLPPGDLASRLGLSVERVESIRPGITLPVAHCGHVQRWFEHISGKTGKALLQTEDGRAVLWSSGSALYLAGWPDETLCSHVVEIALERAGLTIIETGDDLRIRDKGQLRTIVNYGPRTRDAGHLIGSSDEILIGSTTLPVAGVTILKRG